jgi:hypothetical protein
MIQSKDDAVRIAGIAGLRQLNAIDEQIVPRLHAILMRRMPAGQEARAAAAVALANATQTAKPSAVSALSQALQPSRDGVAESQRDPSSASREDVVTVASARSLLQLGGKSYRTFVAERAERSPEPLRSQLRRLLAG